MHTKTAVPAHLVTAVCSFLFRGMGVSPMLSRHIIYPMPARSERSAGIICFKRDKRVTGSRLYLLLDYGHFWDYPKGHVEKNEDDLTAALRELAEETGIDDAQVIPNFHHEFQYFFRDKKLTLIRKSVIFFLAETQSRAITLSHEHNAGEFLPYDRAVDRVTYKNARETLIKAHGFLENAGL